MSETSRPPVPEDSQGESGDQTSEQGERIAKFLARSGVCSRRDAERLIASGRVMMNGERLTSPVILVTEQDRVIVDGKPVAAKQPARLWRYHKPSGLVTTHRDPEGRPTVFESMPRTMPRVVSVGRLDLNSEGLLLLTNDGDLARRLELPANGWTRRYRARVWGTVEQAKIESVARGVVVEGVAYGPIHIEVDRQQSSNAWLTVTLTEGKNREIRRVLDFLGYRVNRLIRVAYGPFQIGPLEPGESEEVPSRMLRDVLSGFGETVPDSLRKMQDTRGWAKARPKRESHSVVSADRPLSCPNVFVTRADGTRREVYKPDSIKKAGTRPLKRVARTEDSQQTLRGQDTLVSSRYQEERKRDGYRAAGEDGQAGRERPGMDRGERPVGRSFSRSVPRDTGSSPEEKRYRGSASRPAERKRDGYRAAGEDGQAGRERPGMDRGERPVGRSFSRSVPRDTGSSPEEKRYRGSASRPAERKRDGYRAAGEDGQAGRERPGMDRGERPVGRSFSRSVPRDTGSSPEEKRYRGSASRPAERKRDGYRAAGEDGQAGRERGGMDRGERPVGRSFSRSVPRDTGSSPEEKRYRGSASRPAERKRDGYRAAGEDGQAGRERGGMDRGERPVGRSFSRSVPRDTGSSPEEKRYRGSASRPAERKHDGYRAAGEGGKKGGGWAKRSPEGSFPSRDPQRTQSKVSPDGKGGRRKNR